ncbi:unnamed protein product [Prunus armeniaca]
MEKVEHTAKNHAQWLPPDIPYNVQDIIDHKMKHQQTPQTPKSVRSSLQNNPEYAVIPVFSPSIPNSFEMQQYDDSDIKKLPDGSYPSSSPWRLLQMNAPEWKQEILGCLGSRFEQMQTYEGIFGFLLTSLGDEELKNCCVKLETTLRNGESFDVVASDLFSKLQVQQLLLLAKVNTTTTTKSEKDDQKKTM